MLGRPRPTSAWLPRFHAERSELVLARLRFCLALGLVGIVVWGVDLLIGPTVDRGLRTDFLLAYALTCLVVGGLTLVPALRRRVLGVALTYIVVLTFGLTLYLQQIPGGAEIAPAVLVFMLLGTTLLLPWGLGAEVAVAIATLAAYLHLYFSVPGPRNISGVPVMLLAGAVAVAGAYLFNAYRMRLCERTWQQAELMALTRELVGEADPAHVMRRIVESAGQLLSADTTVLTMHDASKRMHRIEAATPVDARTGWLLGVEVPDDIPFVHTICTRDELRIPEDDPDSPVVPVLQEYGVRHVLYVPMRQGGRMVGILAFVRRVGRPFAASEGLLARGLADQAALALCNARLVADLRRANQLKSEFVSTMSHELRTPLNVILGFAEMGRDPQMDPLECLARIELAGRELFTLIEGTLEIGRIEAGRDAVQLAPVALDAFWQELGGTCARLPRTGDVALEWAEDVPPLTLVTDPRKVVVMMRNLVGNALKFTERGRVRAEVVAEADDVVLRVADTGIGIRADDREKIFEMFRQGDGSDSRRYGGTGLGLYIVRRFAEQLGGTVMVDSAPGRGSVFTVRLPRRRDDASAAA